MIFPYWDVQRGVETRALPLVPLTIFGMSTSVDVLALVDSGAEQNILGERYAKQLHLLENGGTPVTLIGVGDHPVAGQRTEARFRLGSNTWTAPIIVAPGRTNYAILGQAGFLRSSPSPSVAGTEK